MKNLYSILLIMLLCVVTVSAQISFSDDFEGYQTGDPIAETSPYWNSWGELMSGLTAPFSDDANVVNTFASSGDFSLYLNDATGQGGPQDVLLVFDTTQNITNTTAGNLSSPYTTGTFSFSQMMYVVPGKTGYFNFQAENIPGISWALEVNLDANGGILMSNTSGTNFTCTYPLQTWFEIAFHVDLSNNIWEVFIDSVSQGVFSNSINQIASLDLYPGVSSEYYVDDIYYSYDTSQVVLDNLNLAVSSIIAINGLDGQTRNPSVEVMNLGSTNINSFDIDFEYNGTTITENITGVNIPTVGIYQVDFSNSITLLGGTNNCVATISNINGMMYDDNPNDDTITSQINAIIPAPGKLVVGEEATGTWCGWCPRGAVALNWMDHDYEGYWQGIAVHNGDPMTDAAYDAAMPVSGYPSGIVDRGPDIDPSAFKQDFLQRIVIPPNGIITNGAEITGNTLRVSLTLDVQNYIQGSYKLACVLVEDSVTGSGPNWYQANYYSGGASLVDVDGTDWSTMPGNVPDYMMIYRHVARGVAPTFNGNPLNNSSYNSGDIETQCFEFTLDPSWDQSKMHIVGMLIDASNRIDNASSTNIEEAVNHGLDENCAVLSIGVDLNGPDRINIYPNPAKEEVYISNLNNNNTVVKIYDIKGSLVLEKKIKDKEYLNVSNLSKGVYQMVFETNEITETRKLIKE